MMPEMCGKAGCKGLGLVHVRLHLNGTEFEQWACFDHAEQFAEWCEKYIPEWEQQWGPALLQLVEIP